jgi:DNA-directed RNA polymerase specialized sigma24 family protein
MVSGTGRTPNRNGSAPDGTARGPDGQSGRRCRIPVTGGTIANPDAFRHFLSWLDEGVESHGRKYLDMRRKLVWYFQRKRCASPDDLADETLNRVARRLEEEGTIDDTPAARYCYIVAKYVFLESLRHTDRRAAGAAELARSSLSSGTQTDDRDVMLDCLERCLLATEPADRQLILEYYRADQRTLRGQRHELAERLKLSSNALSIRACRIRQKLETCVSACAGGQERAGGDSAHKQ